MSRIACKTFRLIALLLTSLFIASCGGGGGVAAVPAAKTWTVLVYMDGDNNLSGSALANFAQMQAATGSANVTVVVQLATSGTATKRYQIKNGQTTPLPYDLGEVNMADGQTITDFLTWANAAYPADRTVLILWDHGDGWDELTQRAAAAGARATPHSLAMFTNPGGTTPVLANYQIRQAIEASGIKLDVLGFDGCNMGTIEALYEFRGLAGVLVASEELVPDNGWNYTALLSGLAAAPGMSAEGFGSLAVTAYRNYYTSTQPLTSATLVALRSSGLDAIADEIDSVARQLLAGLANPATGAATLATITQARAAVQEIDPATVFVYVDLVDLFKRLGVTTTLPSLVEAATIAEYHGSARPGAHGISIVFFDLPDAITYNVYDPNYKNYDASTDTGNKGAFITDFQWDEFLHAYYVAAGLL